MKIWKEKTDPEKHRDYVATSHIGGMPVDRPKDNLIESWVYFVKEAGFTFQFVTLAQLETCIDYFSHKTHPSTKSFNNEHEHYWQRWFERLPPGLLKKREKVLKTLLEARQTFKKEKS